MLKQFFFPLISKIVLVAVQDEAANHFAEAFNALRRLGAKDPFKAEYRGSYAFAGYSQPNKPSWVTQVERGRAKGPSEFRITIPLILPRK